MRNLYSLVFLGILVSATANAAQNAPSNKPKLVLTLVIDQFRADYLQRYESKFGPGGFKYLMTNGAYYPFGQYDILQSMTGPGHATVLSGAYPYQMGIPLNTWFDVETGEKVYCAEDKKSQTVGGSVTDPHAGTSPMLAQGSTFGDELKNSGYASKVVALAIKDRAAILLGGHRADLAFWLDGKSYSWVSSSFYLSDQKLPRWLQALNSQLSKEKGKPHSWKGAGFDHSSVVGTRESLATSLGLEITAEAAVRAIDAYQLGSNPKGATDLLAVSFSSFDSIGHMYGPNSPEIEMALMAQDSAIARVLSHIKKTVPLKDVIVVLTGDHGVAPAGEYLNANRFEGGGIDEKKLVVDIEARLNEKFGKPSAQDWIAYSYDLNLWLNRKALLDRKVELSAAQAEVKKLLLKHPSIAYAFSSTDYDERKLPPSMHERQILHTYIKGKSGDVVIIPKPYFYDKGDFASHITGYAYDRTVPIVFAGPGIKPGKYAERAEVIDIAPTLSFLSGALPPSTSEGRVLREILMPQAAAKTQ